MSEPVGGSLPEAQIRQRRRGPSIVWIVPLVAALAGAWLVYRTWVERGPTITVHFSSADGIEVGRTEVRYKAVTVGKVVDVHLDQGLEPMVELELSRSIGEHLECSARFWVVRPRVRGAEISGLGTLLSGTYINMVPSLDKTLRDRDPRDKCYLAVDTPPPARPNQPGRTYELTAETLGSLEVGSPIYFKQLQVGEIINYRMTKKTGRIKIDAFVRAPYHAHVRRTTRFWNASGAELEVSATGATLRVESLVSLLVGGVSFETPPGTDVNASQASPEGAVFVLHSDHASSRTKEYSERLHYAMYFSGSLRGLAVGSSVEFQGIRVGHVENIEMRLDSDSLRVRIPVIVAIEPRRFSDRLKIEKAPRLMREMVKRGMRAKLQSVSLLTGQVIIALAMERNPIPAKIKLGKPYPIFPTSPTEVEQLSRMAVTMATDLKKSLGAIRKFVEGRKVQSSISSLDGVFSEARETLKEARTLLSALRTRTLPSMTGEVTGVAANLKVTLDRMRGSLATIDRLLVRNAPARHKLDAMVRELTAAARSFRQLTQMLRRQPESLLRGRPEQK